MDCRVCPIFPTFLFQSQDRKESIFSMRIESKPLRSSLSHVALPPRTANRQKPPLMVLLHGRGADEHDLIPVTHYLDGRFYLISVRAPFRFPNGGNTWFDIREDHTLNDEQFGESFQKLETFIEEAVAHYDVAPGPIYMFGFSMGAMMALAYTMMHPHMVRAVAAHSGYLPVEGKIHYRWGDISNVSMFIAHGEHDPIIPVKRARATKDMLTPTGAKLLYKEYPIQHQVSQESIADIDTWLKTLLGPVPR